MHQLRLFDRQWLAVTLGYHGLGIEQIDLRRSARHVEKDTTACPLCKLKRRWDHWTGGSIGRSAAWGTEQFGCGKQSEAAPSSAQHLAAMNALSNDLPNRHN